MVQREVPLYLFYIISLYFNNLQFIVGRNEVETHHFFNVTVWWVERSATSLRYRSTHPTLTTSLVPKLRLGMPSSTLRVECSPNTMVINFFLTGNAERCAKAFPNGVWEREKNGGFRYRSTHPTLTLDGFSLKLKLWTPF